MNTTGTETTCDPASPHLMVQPADGEIETFKFELTDFGTSYAPHAQSLDDAKCLCNCAGCHACSGCNCRCSCALAGSGSSGSGSSGSGS